MWVNQEGKTLATVDGKSNLFVHIVEYIAEYEILSHSSSIIMKNKINRTCMLRVLIFRLYNHT